LVVVDFQNRHVESAAAQIVNQDVSMLGHIGDSITQSRRCRFGNDAKHVESGELSGFQSGLTLVFVEVSGNGDDGFAHRIAEREFGFLNRVFAE
jgi:hypothetical protein